MKSVRTSRETANLIIICYTNINPENDTKGLSRKINNAQDIESILYRISALSMLPNKQLSELDLV